MDILYIHYVCCFFPLERPNVFFFGIGKQWSHGIRSISRRAPSHKPIDNIQRRIEEYSSEIANSG